MEFRIIVRGNRKEVMAFLNDIKEKHGAKTKVSDVSGTNRFSNWLDAHEESIRVDKILPKQAG